MRAVALHPDDDDIANGAVHPLLDLLAEIGASGYRFITPSPLTHHRFLSHCNDAGSRTHRDIFGWNRVFHQDDVSPFLLTTMARAGVLRTDAGYRSGVRIASIDADLFLHSTFPTTDEASVFFGPDTYRFVRFVRDFIRAHPVVRKGSVHLPPMRILDIGCGSGAGGIAAARAVIDSGRDVVLTLADISAQALAYAAVNAAFAQIPATTILSDGVGNIAGDFDLIIANPPYLHDEAKRLYRHGGARLGRALSLRLATESLDRLAPGGTLLLYTGVVIVDGVDGLLAELQMPLQQSGCHWSYAEIDPDVFGEELEQPTYRHADRIAAVGLIATRAPRTVE
jgi:methylase of polypeptide subunit release factors